MPRARCNWPRRIGAENLEPAFSKFEQAKSNIPENQNGRVIYEKFVKPAVMTRENVAAHYAISSLFESYPDEAKIFSFIVQAGRPAAFDRREMRGSPSAGLKLLSSVTELRTF